MESVSPDTRWSWVEVDLGALARNARAFRQQIRPGAQMMCVIKADAYGHGAARCAATLARFGADQFAVATVMEGVELRRAGIELPILVLSEPPLGAIDLLLQNRIMPTVYTEEFAWAYGERASTLGLVGDYHLAIDTGMTRIGVAPADVLEFCHAIDFHAGLRRAGTFTHFATADVRSDWDFQMASQGFAEVVREMRDAGVETGIVHCDNTPGTVLHPEVHNDMTRVGIGLYGLHASDATRDRIQLDPVMSVRARVTRVVEPEVGTPVGYGATYRVPRPHTQIATFPIGYADGLARVLSNRMDVLCRGMRFRQVGRICMDQTMFAVSVNSARGYRPVAPIKMGDVVTIVGRDGDEAITMDQMAAMRDTINYEVACGFGMRLEKVYV